MALLKFRRQDEPNIASPQVEAFLEGYSIEVMPRTAEKVENFRDLIPQTTRIYVAHIQGTPIEDMRATVTRFVRDGFSVMPHIPARLITDQATLANWIARYQDAGIEEALLLGGGLRTPVGDFHSSIQLLETGLFDGFKRLHIAGHPEGNKDIDPDGSDKNVMKALRWKQAFSDQADAEVAIVTQFAFEAAPVIAWAERLCAEGIYLPIHVGLAGPAKLQTLLKFAIACGVGPSLRILQKRAKDVTKLVLPFEPTETVAEFARYKAAHPDTLIHQAHLFPLGGIAGAANWVQTHGGRSGVPANFA